MDASYLPCRVRKIRSIGDYESVIVWYSVHWPVLTFSLAA